MAVASFQNNLILEFWDANQLCKLSKFSWHPPPPRWVKANVDATVNISNKAGIGVVFRDCKGRFLFAFGRNFLHWDIAQVEVLSVQAVGDFMHNWMLEAEGIIIESVNYNVIKFFTSIFNKDIDKEGILNPKDLDFLDNFKQICFSFSFRECNRLADCCANLALDSDFLWNDISSNNVHPSFVILLIVDGCMLSSFGIKIKLNEFLLIFLFWVLAHDYPRMFLGPGSLPSSGGRKRSPGSLPSSGGRKRSQGSLPHQVGGKICKGFSALLWEQKESHYSFSAILGREDPGSGCSGITDQSKRNASSEVVKYNDDEKGAVSFSGFVFKSTFGGCSANSCTPSCCLESVPGRLPAVQRLQHELVTVQPPKKPPLAVYFLSTFRLPPRLRRASFFGVNSSSKSLIFLVYFSLVVLVNS
ncbi:hypothetical protein M5K25_009115 [Dendrobium thyrsiflorum]|uniref:RNase H type-1 domain-containing protein n=1 Tax=Dendrobium thyrsiflorum TaxID=117978 RepID=A0ABD0V5F7_DENTH